MIDLKLLEKDFDNVSEKLITKKVSKELLEEIKSLFIEKKKIRQELDNTIFEQKKLSKEFGIYKKENKDITILQDKINNLKSNKQKLDNKHKEIEEKLYTLASKIPNIPDSSVPIGENEDDNVEIKKVLTPKEFDFEPKEHWELAQINNWIDFTRGVKLAKTRFSAFCNDGAKLERALINYMLDFNAKRGFKEWSVPYLANSNTLFGTGQLPKFEDDLFKIENEDLYLIPTSEVQLTNLFNNEILDKDDLPLLLTSYTACFRKEAGSAGRDTKGIIRQHQFDKVEIVSICKEDESDEIFEKMVECASDLLTSLNLPHRLVNLCTGDLGFSAGKTIDLEVWLPGQNKYREISSVSNTRDFQARRAKIRYKDNKKNKLCHTLNGSSLAVGRTLVAIMENYQREDGSIEIPEVLKKYL